MIRRVAPPGNLPFCHVGLGVWWRAGFSFILSLPCPYNPEILSRLVISVRGLGTIPELTLSSPPQLYLLNLR